MRGSPMPLECKFCDILIIHDGQHWSDANLGRYAKIDHQDVQKARMCPNAPAMVRFHVPKNVDPMPHTRCVPEV